MRVKIVAILMILLLVFGIAGCSSKQEQVSKSIEAPSSAGKTQQTVSTPAPRVEETQKAEPVVEESAVPTVTPSALLPTEEVKAPETTSKPTVTPRATEMVSTPKPTATAQSTAPQASATAATKKPSKTNTVTATPTQKIPQVKPTEEKTTPNQPAQETSDIATTAPVTVTEQPQPTPTKAVEAEPEFDIDYWISYAKRYAQSVGLALNSEAIYCWDNPIGAGAHCNYLERDIQSRLNRYGKDEDITEVSIWAEPTGVGTYEIYIGYA